ncbi:MAG: GNAT family N-acetyltransferase [Actinobacteria bacterium]|nr:GNAT family N-acetyltransferase [Actinomycetota bacterium]
MGRAHPDDAGEIIALQRAAYRIEAERYDDFGLPPLTETADEFVAALDTHTVLVARRRDGEPSAPIVGTARARVVGDTAHIARLSVLPALHGQGIGRQLLAAIEHETAPVRRYELFTGHRSERNLRMYERAGYRRIHTEPQSDAVLLIFMEKARR